MSPVRTRTRRKAAPRRPQQRRSEQTRRQILEAAEALFARDGYSGASLGTLADEVGIHKPGIFYYFPNKRALYEAVLQDVIGSVEASQVAILGSDRPARERILEATASWVDSLAARPSLARLLLHEFANPDSAASPPVFAKVGERIQTLMTAAFRELRPRASDDDLFHHYSLMTGGTLFYASAMQRLGASSDAEHSMEHHRELLLAMTRDFLRRLPA